LPDTETVVRGFERELDMSLIDISEENVRKTNVASGLEDLKASIERLGLIQPIIVMKSGDRFKLIVGQRRLLACQALGKTRIPALIVGRVDETTRKLLSFGENVNRKRLPFNDTIAVCDALFEAKAGSNIDKIAEIASDLGINEQTVKRYLGYKLIPKKTRDLVTEGKLSADVAARIASGWFPNEKAINEIAEYATHLTPPERRRLIEIGAQKGGLSAQEVIEESKKPRETLELVIHISPAFQKLIEEEASARNLDVSEFIREAVASYIKGEA
jgi:ParB/RepB/Spo0J family partition protein